MELYTILRAFADSWMLLFLFLLFVGIVIWVSFFRRAQDFEESAGIPFRHHEKPALDKATLEEAQS